MKAKVRSSLSLDASRWTLYAGAAAATGLSAVTAEAEIHYSGNLQHKIANPHGSAHATCPLSGNAAISFFNYSRGPNASYNIASFAIRGAAVSQGFRASHGPPYVGVGASRLYSGDAISHGLFRRTSPSSTYGNIRSFYGGGHWDSGGRGFVGFKFNTGAGTQYGWVRIKITPAPAVKIVVVDYAWGDPGDIIVTGQRRGRSKSTAAVPASSSLGLLALGAKGVSDWREERH